MDTGACSAAFEMGETGDGECRGALKQRNRRERKTSTRRAGKINACARIFPAWIGTLGTHYGLKNEVLTSSLTPISSDFPSRSVGRLLCCVPLNVVKTNKIALARQHLARFLLRHNFPRVYSRLRGSTEKKITRSSVENFFKHPTTLAQRTSETPQNTNSSFECTRKYLNKGQAYLCHNCMPAKLSSLIDSINSRVRGKKKTRCLCEASDD